MARRFSVEAAFSVIDRMTKPLRKMRRKVKNFTKASSLRVAKLGKAFFKTGAMMGKAFAAGAAIGAAALGASILKTAELGDEAAKTARRLGISAEALQEFRFAADRQGVSAETLNSSFLALQKRVGELKSGTGSLYGFLKKTGDKAFARQLLMAKDTGEAFEMVTKKAATISDPLKRAAFAAAAFSRSGVKMLSFMEAGTEGIKQLRLEARKYGAVISDEAAGQSEIFIDSLTNLKSSIAGIGKTFSSKLIPFLSVLMQRFADFWALNKKGISLGMDKFLSFLVVTFQEIKPGVVALWNSLKRLFGLFFDAVGSILPEFDSQAIKLSDVINMLTGALIVLADAGAEAFQFIEKISPFLKPFLATLMLYKGIVIAITLVTKGWAIIQGILNAVMAVNPISLIILGIAALIVTIVMLIKHWDTVVAVFKTGVEMIWGFLSGLLDNPFFAAIGVVFLPFLAIPALIVKHWEPIKTFFAGLWDWLSQIFVAGIDFIGNIFQKLPEIVKKELEPLISFFDGIWDRLLRGFKAASDFIGDIAARFGFDFNEDEPSADEKVSADDRPQAVTRSEQTRKIIEENRAAASAEVLIRDETGRAELSRQNPVAGVKIAMVNSGGR